MHIFFNLPLSHLSVNVAAVVATDETRDKPSRNLFSERLFSCGPIILCKISLFTSLSRLDLFKGASTAVYIYTTVVLVIS